jgi:hypothetical protein
VPGAQGETRAPSFPYCFKDVLRDRWEGHPMSKNKIAWLLAAALLWTVPALADKEQVRSFSKRLPTGSVRRVELDFPVGEVVVDAWNGADLQLDVQLRCRRGQASCRDAAERVRLVYSTDDDKLHIEIKDWPKLSGKGLEARVQVQMPRRLPLDVDLGVGEMRVAGLENDVKANVGVGELNLTLPASAVATVSADTGVGDANLTAGGRHYESSGLFTKELRWKKGTGSARVAADCGVGQINVKLQ